MVNRGNWRHQYWSSESDALLKSINWLGQANFNIPILCFLQFGVYVQTGILL